MVLNNPIRTVNMTILGHFRGLYMGSKCSYTWVMSTMNLQGLRFRTSGHDKSLGLRCTWVGLGAL